LRRLAGVVRDSVDDPDEVQLPSATLVEAETTFVAVALSIGQALKLHR
jgi:hypothetical protein